MNSINKDPLLVTAKVVTIIVRIGLVIGMIGLGIAGAVVAFDGAGLSDHLIVKVGPEGLAEVKWAAVLAIFIALVSLGLAYEFVAKLAQIIDTVGEGDPFTSDNAARLTRMAWLAIIVQLISLPIMFISTWMESRVDEGVFKLDSDMSLTGFGLALVLFILARVFRKGTEMREDLEGTVGCRSP